jgi:hypothetical protein
MKNAYFILTDMSAASDLPLLNSSTNHTSKDLSEIYPTATDCEPPPIFIMACQCSTGAFDNLTNEQIVTQFIETLEIDKDSTSKAYRKLNSAVDNRPESVAIGRFS